MEKKRVALVTGGNKGIGFFIVKKLCQRLPKDLWVVVLGSRSVENGEKAVEELKRENLPMVPVFHQLDITDKASRDGMKKYLKDTYGGLDCLVNNAGYAFKRSATDSKEVQAKTTLGINYFGTKHLTDDLWPLLRDGARVVSVASMCGKFGLEHMSEAHRSQILANDLTFEKLDSIMNEYIEAAKGDRLVEGGWPDSTYEMSKTGVIAVTRLWAKKASEQSSPKGVFVACCCPGWCKSDMAGWEQPPLTADDGAETIVHLTLGGGEQEYGEFLMEKKVIDLGFSRSFVGTYHSVGDWMNASL
ncbi:carbonyl reductase [Cystoisospora suis]|uniref:Carbonyl reductase n=1 Tax=Cystoisospora suis TaxID=483139 RepID=A0A2C6L1X1_9APIC|nr:carbonyl reductase [Cystoisospora suis]